MSRAESILWVLLVLPLLGAACNEQLLNPMADHRQPRERAFRPSDFYADGLAMRRPAGGDGAARAAHHEPALTVGDLGYATQLAPNGERVVRYANKIPVPVTPELMALGRKCYDITCGTCHGPLGDGKSIVGQADVPASPAFVADLRRSRPRVHLRGGDQRVRYDGVLTPLS